MDISKYLAGFRSGLDLTKVKTKEDRLDGSKEQFENLLAENISRMSGYQEKLYAQNRYALLVIIQAMDTAGKDGTIKHVMSGLNPQGTHVHSFKQPSLEELDHDYLWRAVKNLPERGQIGIFNRSYYEEVLVVRVHDLIRNQQIPHELVTPDIWKDRFRQIRDFERYLFENGIVTVKFFLHISKEEQKNRLLERIDDETKRWKFAAADIKERSYWNDYQHCYQEAISETSTDYAPWYIIPADKKKFARLLVSEIINQALECMQLEYPRPDNSQEADLKRIRTELLES